MPLPNSETELVGKFESFTEPNTAQIRRVFPKTVPVARKESGFGDREQADVAVQDRSAEESLEVISQKREDLFFKVIPARILVPDSDVGAGEGGIWHDQCPSLHDRGKSGYL